MPPFVIYSSVFFSFIVIPYTFSLSFVYHARSLYKFIMQIDKKAARARASARMRQVVLYKNKYLCNIDFFLSFFFYIFY